jgi:hypothetical protein
MDNASVFNKERNLYLERWASSALAASTPPDSATLSGLRKSGFICWGKIGMYYCWLRFKYKEPRKSAAVTFIVQFLKKNCVCRELLGADNPAHE